MDDFVFLCVVGGRFVLPLLIPRFPLPAIIACLILDGVDQTIFQAFGYDPPGYQSYDKAMDVFYLAIAYLSTMRNWEHLGAYQVARFLFFYRLVGAFLFEMTHVRALLVIFPNTFEYFFIAYEAIRTRWSPVQYLTRWWIWLAALIWIFVKLPQEYWLHIAGLDVTDTLEDYWWAWPVLIAVVIVAVSFLWFVARPKLGPTTHGWQIESGPVPPDVDTAAKLAQLRITGGWVLSWMTLEKVVLVGVISAIYAQILPGFDQSTLRTFTSVGVLIVVNAAITVAVSRREWTIESAGLAVVARLLANVVLVFAADRFLGNGAAGWDTFFFLCLISLITTLHDRYQPVLAHRESEAVAVRSGSAR